MTVARPVRHRLGTRIIKVNHAGEHGAVCIYSGQLVFARLWDPRLAELLGEFRAHERMHRSLFENELRRRAQRRCRSYGLCALGGFGLGIVTGALGPAAITATTVAVESVVLSHLQEQIRLLSDCDPEAAAAVAAIVADEREHHDRAELQVAADSLWTRVLTPILKPIVSVSTEAVIWLGMRL